MYSKAELANIRKEFWTTFGLYMKPVPSAFGHSRMNWQNYKTGVKDIYFRMKAEREFVSIGIEITHKDEELQALFFQQFEQFRKLLEAETQEVWDWKLHASDDFGQTYSYIQCYQANLNVLNKEHWPAIISFLKPRIMALDRFWENIKPGFEE